MYFRQFPKIFYDFKYSNRDIKIHSVTDITTNVRFRKDLLQNVVAYDMYDIRDGETPEILAERFYGDAQLHWIIMLGNDKYDYINDFPMTVVELEKFIEDKYGDTKYDVKYYTLDGFIVSYDTPGAGTISNYDWEFMQNDKKRQVKIFTRESIKAVLDRYAQITRNARGG